MFVLGCCVAMLMLAYGNPFWFLAIALGIIFDDD